jgi:hypothetical protein
MLTNINALTSLYAKKVAQVITTKLFRSAPKTLDKMYGGFDCIYDNPDCAVYYKDKVGSSRAIVSFTGVGHALGGIDLQSPEFFRASQIASVFFVIDKNRTWGNHLNIEEISRLIMELSQNKEITCIGNSMGGFLAILFSSHLAASSVIAFTPQWSICGKIVPGEQRWRSYRNNISKIVYADLSSSFNLKADYLVLFGSGSGEDMHRKFFLEIDGCKVLKFADAGHNVASYLKDENLLYSLIEKWIDREDIFTVLREKNICFE